MFISAKVVKVAMSPRMPVPRPVRWRKRSSREGGERPRFGRAAKCPAQRKGDVGCRHKNEGDEADET